MSARATTRRGFWRWERTIRRLRVHVQRGIIPPRWALLPRSSLPLRRARNGEELYNNDYNGFPKLSRLFLYTLPNSSARSGDEQGCNDSRQFEAGRIPKASVFLRAECEISSPVQSRTTQWRSFQRRRSFPVDGSAPVVCTRCYSTRDHLKPTIPRALPYELKRSNCTRGCTHRGNVATSEVLLQGVPRRRLWHPWIYHTTYLNIGARYTYLRRSGCLQTGVGVAPSEEEKRRCTRCPWEAADSAELATSARSLVAAAAVAATAGGAVPRIRATERRAWEGSPR